MIRRVVIFKFILPLTILLTNISSFAATKIAGPDVDNFITSMVKTHSFKKTELEKIFATAKYQEDVIAAIQKPAEKLPWYRYEKIFLKDNRVQGGVKFWQENKSTLEKASKVYGVPPEIIVSLIGVETFYGAYKGKYPVLDSLATLAFYYKPRAKFFTSELEQLLLYAREEKEDPQSFYGSYAGAMGYPQFISSSIRNYAVDFTNNGKRDLHNNVADAIGSVANYLNKNGWVKGQPITTKATLKGNKYKALEKDINQLQPKFTVKKLKTYGITTSQAYNGKLTTSLLSFEINSDKDKQNQEYWLGFNNFYVITRYNISQNYALAVYKLSEKIKTEYNKKNKTKSV